MTDSNNGAAYFGDRETRERFWVKEDDEGWIPEEMIGEVEVFSVGYSMPPNFTNRNLLYF